MFGSNSLTASIGVFTINLPRIRYLSSTESEFKARLWRMACVGKTSLEIKRKILEQQSEAGLYPFSTYFLRDVKQRTGQYWFNHFSKIGIIGMNEVLLNFIGKEITTDEGQKFAIRMEKYLRNILVEFQEETGHVYNLEATPAEAASYRLALADKSRYPDIITAGKDVPYYTNSTQVPVGFTEDIFYLSFRISSN